MRNIKPGRADNDIEVVLDVVIVHTPGLIHALDPAENCLRVRFDE
jgi:hypothetical protein